jgi:hypothetical protein
MQAIGPICGNGYAPPLFDPLLKNNLWISFGRAEHQFISLDSG